MQAMQIRGLGVVTAAGGGRQAFVEALHSGDLLGGPSATHEGFETAELEGPPKKLLRRKGLVPLSRSSLLTAAALEDLFSCDDASEDDDCGDDCGLVVGTAFGHVDSKAAFHAAAHNEGPAMVSPILFPNTIINSLAGHAAILFGLRGPNSTITSGRRSGLEALLRARSLLLSGRARHVVVAACDEISVSLLRGLEADGLFTGGVSPSGVRVGEAAVAVILEGPGTAPGSFGLLGQGESSTVGRSLEEAARAAMTDALESAGLGVDDLAGTSLSTSGIEELDGSELGALHAIGAADKPTSAFKAVFGETFGAAGLLACAATGVVADGAPVLVSAVDSAGAMAVIVGTLSS